MPGEADSPTGTDIQTLTFIEWPLNIIDYMMDGTFIIFLVK